MKRKPRWMRSVLDQSAGHLPHLPWTRPRSPALTLRAASPAPAGKAAATA